jgi:uncharacterized protein YjfI (DUF2170 family)
MNDNNFGESSTDKDLHDKYVERGVVPIHVSDDGENIVVDASFYPEDRLHTVEKTTQFYSSNLKKKVMLKLHDGVKVIEPNDKLET